MRNEDLARTIPCGAGSLAFKGEEYRELTAP